MLILNLLFIFEISLVHIKFHYDFRSSFQNVGFLSRLLIGATNIFSPFRRRLNLCIFLFLRQ